MDILIQKRRNAKAAKRLMLKLLKKQGFYPRVIITDKLKSYGAAFREMGLGIEHRQHKGLNNQAGNLINGQDSERRRCEDSSLHLKHNDFS